MRVVQFDTFIQEEESIDWLIAGLLPNVGWTMLVGEKGVGKTTFALQMCKSLQEGTDFLGREVIKTKILYVQADSLTSEWREIVKSTGVRNTGLTIVDVPMGCMDNPIYVEYISNAVKQTHVGFVVFDSFYKMTNVSINTEKVLQPLQRMKAVCHGNPWAMLHHPSKADSNDGSGHNSISGDCSNLWVLFRNRLAVKKARLRSQENIDLEREGKLWKVKEDKGSGGFDFLKGRVE